MPETLRQRELQYITSSSKILADPPPPPPSWKYDRNRFQMPDPSHPQIFDSQVIRPPPSSSNNIWKIPKLLRSRSDFPRRHSDNLSDLKRLWCQQDRPPTLLMSSSDTLSVGIDKGCEGIFDKSARISTQRK